LDNNFSKHNNNESSFKSIIRTILVDSEKRRKVRVGVFFWGEKQRSRKKKKKGRKEK